MLTDSADKGDWAAPAKWCDILGVNLYTRLWDGRRYVDIDVAPARYTAKIRSVSASEVIVSEPRGQGGQAALLSRDSAQAGYWDFCRGSSCGLTYFSPHGPTVLICMTVSSSMKT